MDLASGYSDSINYGNGYTPLATGAINNNNAEYLRNQMAMAMMAQAYNPYANSGGSFGAQPAAYAGIGADYGRAVGGGGNIYAPQQPQPSVFETGADPYQQWLQAGGYNAPANWTPSGQGGIGSDAARTPNQPAITPQQTYVGGFNPYDASSFARGAQRNVGGGYGGGAAAGLPGLADTRTPQQTDYSQIPSGIFTGDFRQQPQQYSGGGIGSDAVRDPYQDWLQNNAASQGYGTLPPFWQGVRNMTGMGQPGGGGYDPYAGLGNQGQQGVIDPMGYGTGGYQGNAIPAQQPQPQPQQQQPNNLPWFWQGVRDVFGADPKDQSRVPQSDGGYPGATNPNYQPGGMAPQKPFESWVNAS